jgi:hypothetical protein
MNKQLLQAGTLAVAIGIAALTITSSGVLKQAQAENAAQTGSQAKPDACAKKPSKSKGKTAKNTEKTTETNATAKAKEPEEKAEYYPPVLDPAQFFGEAQMGYASAKAAPEVMAKIFCYCGCDVSDSHTRLLDCYTSMHGVDCHYCQEEATLALRLHKDGKSIAEIQKEIDQTYSHVYPFTEETAALKKYKANRLWKPDDTKTSKAGSADKVADAGAQTKIAAAKSATGKPKLKPGFTAGKCCAHSDHK